MTDARIQPMTRYEAEQARLRARIEAAPPAYQDRFMDTSQAEASATEGELTPEPTGMRSWLFETRAGAGRTDNTGLGKRSATEYGGRVEYRQETQDYGDLLLQVDGRMLQGDLQAGWSGIGALGYAREPTSARVTLRSLGLPLSPLIFADSTLGDTYSGITDGLSRNYRMSLGTSVVRGASTRIFGADFDVRAGTGQRGLLTGGPYPGFEKNGGTLTWLGATRRWADQWYVAGQIDRARNVPAYYLDPLTGQGAGSKDVSSWAMSVGRGQEVLSDGAYRLRVTAVGSHVRSGTPGVTNGRANGLFVEGSVRLGTYRHEIGAYTASSNLHFGDFPLPIGTRGAYWRMDQNSSRLSWGLGLDLERTAPGANFSHIGYDRSGTSGYVQYVLDRHSSMGGNFNVYNTRFDGNNTLSVPLGRSRSMFASAFYQTRLFALPRTRITLTLHRNDLIVLNGEAATGEELQWEQEWIASRQETQRTELTTTLGYARDRSSGATRRYPTAGVQFRYWPDSTLSLNGSLRYTSQSGDLSTSRGLSGTVSAEKELGQGWRLGLAASLNQARSSVVPTSSFGPQVYRGNDKGVYVFLRWEGSAGVPYAPLGVRTGAGAGRIEGRVFFDANRDGIAQPDEGSAAGIEVVLDGRYRTATDRDGRFEFPLVATGRHQLSLTPESVPLPWGGGDSGASIEVPLRGSAFAPIPVTRVAP
ncbi:hypothetical protein J2W27_004376 [Variovorax boronicumulans]|uniref:hypothetical protein n=1 Tax=Variovorax boronicumulans TaxID=436515 RepID=UPI00277D68EA|nr:hypothetical protein [Variovorax boronicumulans]MDP9912250.1 hypothetical protein [Variovorax boronicumulans]